jgi:hypothetical protein
MGIIKTHTLYTTQISCLNDASEWRYLADLASGEAKRRAPLEPDGRVRQLYEQVIRDASERNVVNAGIFVGCLSDAHDDLSQWRGYGGGECAFAIELDTKLIAEALAARNPGSLLTRVIYDEEEQKELLNILINKTVELFRNAETKGIDEQVRWYELYGPAYMFLSAVSHARVKSPKFSGEKEYRIFTQLLPDEHKHLEFSAKRTLLARHLPLHLGTHLLPIRSVMVGPTGYPDVSRISVGDLLKKHGYGDLPVGKSAIPYRDI